MPKKTRRGFNFNTMEFRAPNYSRFNLSHDRLQCLGAGLLTPLWWTEMVPGDVFTVRYSGFMRLLALASPMLQREDIFIRAFFVPFRILANQDDVDKLFAGSKSGEHYDTPFINCTADRMTVGSLYDALELPLPYTWNSATNSWQFVGNDTDLSPSVSAFPFLAYQRIYHDHFRNEETEDDFLDAFKNHFADIDQLDGEDFIPESNRNAQFDELRRVCWERDYLTSALASPQRGSQVLIPMAGSAPVKVNNDGITSDFNGQEIQYQSNSTIFPGNLAVAHPAGSSTQPLNLTVDGSSFTGIGAVALRLAMNLQAFMERNNIAGYRMIGNTLAHFGVQSSNKLQDEAQYLGGIKAPITISAVTQTSATQDLSGLTSTPQGTQVGQAQASFTDTLFTNFRTEERGILMIVGYINAKSSYSQGLPRKWTRRSYLDYYWPEFQTIGEQEILNQEVFFKYYEDSEGNNINENTWAYQSRYSEYKYEPDSLGGEFRTSLSYWHQSRLFTDLPAFNDSFVKSNPSSRVFAVNTETYPRPYLLESYFEVDTVRPMSKYAQSKLW